MDFEDKSVLDELRDVVEVAVEISADGKITMQEMFRLIGEIIQAASAVVDLADEPNEHYEAIVDAAEALFDQYVTPYDIASVPNWLEPYVKQLVRGLIRPAIEGLFEALADKEGPADGD